MAPFLMRLVLGGVFIHWAYKEFRNRAATGQTRILAGVEGIAGILLVIGLWTQGAALFAIADLVIRLGGRVMKKSFLTDGVNYYLILLVLALSLLVLGAGAFAFDLSL